MASELRKRQAKIKSHVEALERFIAEALTEPNVPFLRPLNAVSYNKLLGSFSRISDLCLYVCDGLENLSGVQPTFGAPWDHISHDLEGFQEKLQSTVKCLEEIALTKSQARVQKELERRKICHDVEARTTSNDDHSNMELGPSQDDAERFLVSFVIILKEASGNSAEEVIKSETALCLSSLGFCISRLMQETICIMTEITHTI